MASYTLYPLIVDSYMPAFEAGNNSYCKLYFRLSKFNDKTDFFSVQKVVTKQNTGMNVVNKIDSNNRYCATEIILNINFEEVPGEDNLYYIKIENEDLSSKLDNFVGWIQDRTYKI